MIANTQNGFPSPFPSLGLSYWEKKSHTFAEQWDNNQLQWSFKKHDTNWFLISERFSSYDFKNEPYGWASTLEINERKQPRRDSNAHFLLYLTVTIILRRWFFFFPGCQSAVMINLIQVSQCLIVGQRSLTIIILLNPEFEIFPFEVVRAIIVLLWFFFLMHLPILIIR